MEPSIVEVQTKVSKIGMVPVEKTYYSKVPGSTYTFQDGHQIQFLHGRFVFNPDNYQDTFLSQSDKHPLNGKLKADVYFNELEHLVRTGNPLIFDQGTLPIAAIPEGFDAARNALSEAARAEQDQALAKVNHREMGELNISPAGAAGVVTGVNESTVDRDLQNTILAPKVTGPGAAGMSKAEQIKAEAAARLATTASSQNSNGMS